MKTLYKRLLLLSLICASFTACKLDPPIFPKGTDTALPQNNSGSGATTGTTNAPSVTDAPITNAGLTGTWTFKADYTELFDVSYNITKEISQAPAFYKTVQIDDSRQKAVFADPALSISDTFSYTLTKDKGKNYIQFSTDPFFRTANFRVEISEQNTSAMTWIIIDPKITDIGDGKSGYNGHKVMFTR